MKNQKYTPWNISPNTDTVDIDNKCLGLMPKRSTIPKDVADHIHSNRGLHIQIRHNGDAQTYAQANELSRLIAAAPELLEALEATLPLLKTYCEDRYNSMEENLVLSKDAKEDARLILSIEDLIRKAKGES